MYALHTYILSEPLYPFNVLGYIGLQCGWGICGTQLAVRPRHRLSRSAAPRAAAEAFPAQSGALLAAGGRALGSVARAPLQSQQAIGKLCVFVCRA